VIVDDARRHKFPITGPDHVIFIRDHGTPPQYSSAKPHASNKCHPHGIHLFGVSCRKVPPESEEVAR